MHDMHKWWQIVMYAKPKHTKLLLHVVLLCEMFCSVGIVLWNVWPNVDAQQVGKYFGETCTILAHCMWFVGISLSVGFLECTMYTIYNVHNLIILWTLLHRFVGPQGALSRSGGSPFYIFLDLWGISKTLLPKRSSKWNSQQNAGNTPWRSMKYIEYMDSIGQYWTVLDMPS